MELFPDETHLPLLEQALDGVDASVRAQALRTIPLQIQTPKWEDMTIGLLKSDYEAIRQQAIESLTRRRSEKVLQALREHLALEKSEILREKIERALNSRN
jgi:hypothetical protein